MEYDPKCERHLTQAVKLNPYLAEAWNELGECLWKKNDHEAAIDCFKVCLVLQFLFLFVQKVAAYKIMDCVLSGVVEIDSCAIINGHRYFGSLHRRVVFHRGCLNWRTLL